MASFVDCVRKCPQRRQSNTNFTLDAVVIFKRLRGFEPFAILKAAQF